MKGSVKALTAEYVVDDNKHAWLSRVSHCVVGPALANASFSPIKQAAPPKIGIADQGVSTGNIDTANNINGAVPQSRSVSANTAITTSKLREAVSEQRHVPSTSPVIMEDLSSASVIESKRQQLSKVYGTTDTSLSPVKDNAVMSSAAASTGGGGGASKLGLKKDILERKKKKKDKVNTSSASESSGSGFKRSQLDAPPDYNQMAKFAAEKALNEKQLQQQHQQQRSLVDEEESWVEENRRNVSHNQAQGQGGRGNGGNNNKRSPKKQHTQHPSHPGNLEALEHSERRLAELEKLAVSTATIKSHLSQNQLLPLGANGYPLASTQLHSSIGTRANMSGSEADFLVRQINTADVSQLSLFSNLDGFEPVAAKMAPTANNDSFYSSTVNKANNNNSTSDVMTNAFAERIASLERQLASVQASADKKELEIEKRDIRLKKIAIELESHRREAQNDLKRLQGEHEVEILRIREQHSREKAALTNVSNVPTVNASSDNSSPTLNHSGQVGETIGNIKLFEQLEALRLEQRRLQDSFADERRSIQIDCSNKLLLQERKLKSEIMELRSAATHLEDRIATGREELSAAMGTIHQLKSVNAQMDLAKREAVEQQSKLRADIKNMQQSVQASYRLETSQQLLQSSGTAAADPESAMRLNDAKNEAKSRQLTNKIEFLKSQLDAEKKNNDDLRVGMDSTKQKLDEIRDEFKFRMQEAERNKQTAVDEAEQRVELMYEERMRDFTTLQSRVMSLQGQLQDVSAEHVLSKQLEEKQKTATMKQIAITTALKTEIEQQRALIAQLRDEKELETVKESNKSNNDAIIRRLDNERQYLKSQLTSEITHKSEMQAELSKCTAQNKDIQKQWNDDVMSLKDSLQTEQQRQRERENHFRQVEAGLSTELEASKSQLKDLKDGFVKTRDLLRMEQLNIENTVTANRRLTEQLELANSDIAQLRAQDQQNALSYKQQIELINSTIRDAEASHKKELLSLRDELSRQYLANSSEQSNIMELREKHVGEKMKITRLVHTTKMVNIFNKWKLSRIYIAFRVWNTNTTLVSVAGQFRLQVEDMLKTNTEEMAAEQTKSEELLAKRFAREHGINVALLNDNFEKRHQRALDRAAEDKQNALDAAYTEYQTQTQQLETDFAFDLNKARVDCEMEILRVSELKDIQYEALHDRLKEAALVAKELAHEQLLKAEAAKEEEMNVLWTEKLKVFEAELQQTHQKVLSNLQIDNDCVLHSQQAEHRQKVTALNEKHERHLQITIEGLEAKHHQFLEELQIQKEQDLLQLEADVRAEETINQQKQRAEMHESTESRIRELRELWQAEFDEKMVVKTQEFEALLVEKMEEFSKSVEVDKQRAVKLEGSKWKQALKDLEQTNELTVMKMRAEVMQQKDAEYKVELERATNRFEAQKQKEFTLHLSVIEDIKKEHKLVLERQSNKFELQCEVLRVEVESAVKQSYDAEWNEKMRHLLLDCEQGWKAKIAKEKEKSENLRNDLTQTTALFVEERSTLQRAVAKCDDRVASMESMNKADMQQLRAELEAEREMSKLEEHEHHKQLRAVFDAEKVQLGEEIETKFKVISDNAIKAEQQRLAADLERQMTAIQEESEKLVGSLEKAMSGLKAEKTELATQLETLTVKLEDTEDVLYDLQQETKRVTKEASLTLWKSVTNTIKMQQRFQRGIEEFDVEARKRHDATKREMQTKLNESTLLAMQLTALLQDVEANRKKSHSILSGYKSEDIATKRSAVRLLERELERITLEKDSLEEQRELMESDVLQLEGQVRELEEHIREHNRESSMTNGRINVAHARKKRRLDSELERMLESIEQKRHNMAQLDQRVAEKGRERDEKELDMIDIEKQLMGILLEQQRHVLGHIDESRSIEDRCKVLVSVARLPYPVSANPTIGEVIAMVKEQERQDERG
eukprot:gene24755-31132_t